MFKIIWDKETGGVLLNSKVTKDTLGISPRPVFFEELDLLELEKLGWTYPRVEAPIMWAVNKQYWYKGVMLFEAKGANIYDLPTLVFASGVEPMALEVVDVAEMLRRNADQMFLLESEAIEFIRDTFVTYSKVNHAHDTVRANQEIDFEAMAAKVEKKTKTKMAVIREDCDSFDIVPLDVANEEGKRVLLSTRIDRFIASFSGGKDSQVVLDLCTRAIPPTDFEVIYSDTGYELPPSLDLYEQVQRYYKERFPALKFTTTRNHESVLNYWDKIGTPSDTHRWCCSVMKTAPLYRFLKVEGNKQARVLTFDGVRAEESTRRSGYDRIGKGKHIFTYNAHPILKWNNVEIYLYLFKYNLQINQAYRLGKSRVGCIICPFSTPWDDSIINHFYPEELKPFIDKIIQYSAHTHIKDIKTFLSERKWKLKILGNISNLPQIRFIQDNHKFRAEIENPKQSVFSWLPSLCDYTVSSNKIGYFGDLKFKNSVHPYTLVEDFEKGKTVFEISGIYDQKLILLIKRLIQKVSHCIQCEVCEVDCPTGALSITPQIKINKSKCIHCHKCLNVHDRGCIVADCNRMVKDSDTSLKIYGYKKFGFREEWLDDFMSDPESFWANKDWGQPMYEAFKRWGKDALILDSKNELTELGSTLKDIYSDNPTLVWEIIWINLSYNSFIVDRFCANVPVGRQFNSRTLLDAILEKESVNAVSTLNNACLALLDLLDKTPVGEDLQQGEERDKMKVRTPYSDLSAEAIAYSLFKYGEVHDTTEMRVSDFYAEDTFDGIYRQFGISKNDFIKGLRYLSSQSDRVLIAELNMGLDHITLDDKITTLDVLKKLAIG